MRHSARKRTEAQEPCVPGRRKTPSETCLARRPLSEHRKSVTVTAGRRCPAGAVWGGRRAVGLWLSPADDAREGAGWGVRKPHHVRVLGGPGDRKGGGE